MVTSCPLPVPAVTSPEPWWHLSQLALELGNDVSQLQCWGAGSSGILSEVGGCHPKKYSSVH